MCTHNTYIYTVAIVALPLSTYQHNNTMQLSNGHVDDDDGHRHVDDHVGHRHVITDVVRWRRRPLTTTRTVTGGRRRYRRNHRWRSARQVRGTSTGPLDPSCLPSASETHSSSDRHQWLLNTSARHRSDRKSKKIHCRNEIKLCTIKLEFHWDQFPRNFLADLLATSPTSS